MNILINAVSAKSGGAATYLLNLVQSLSAREDAAHHCYVLLVPPKVIPRRIKFSAPVIVHETEIGSSAAWRRFLWDQIVVRRLIKSQSIDVIVSSSDFGMLWPPRPQILLLRNALFFSRLYRRHILSKHSWWYCLGHLIRKLLIAMSARASVRVLVASCSMMRDVQNELNLSAEAIRVNPFGIPERRFDCPSLERREPGREAFRMLYVAEYGDYKNFTVLYKAIRILSQQGVNDILLVTTADPWQNSTAASVSRSQDQRLITDPFVAPFVKNLGYVPYDEVPRLYADCDLFVFPSLAESFGHPLVEAMASGRPIVASDTPINREICGEAAHYFEPLDAVALSRAIRSLREDAGTRCHLAAEGQRRVHQQFKWPNHVERLVDAIEEVIGYGQFMDKT
jgi:glycosyltransferase involved in cell wall biosynthesis